VTAPPQQSAVSRVIHSDPVTRVTRAPVDSGVRPVVSMRASRGPPRRDSAPSPRAAPSPRPAI